MSSTSAPPVSETMPKTADNLLTGRLALVTGASGGIGAAIAHELILREVDLALTYSSSREAVESLVTQLKDVWERKYGVHIIKNECPVITIHQADLASADQTVKLCQDVNEKHGRPVDILIANAGYGKRIQDIWDISLDEFEHTLNVNLRAPFLLAKGVVGGMKAQGWGRIVFVSSIAAYGAGINGCHYAASKGGMMGMMKNLASRLAEHGITVNDVAPAMIGRTGMIPNESTVPGLVNTIPVGRLGTPKEVADAVLMFCTNGYTTGQSLVISGGLRHH